MSPTHEGASIGGAQGATKDSEGSDVVTVTVWDRRLPSSPAAPRCAAIFTTWCAVMLPRRFEFPPADLPDAAKTISAMVRGPGGGAAVCTAGEARERTGQSPVSGAFLASANGDVKTSQKCKSGAAELDLVLYSTGRSRALASL